MKRVSVIICILLCFVLTDKAHAQRCLPGTKGLRITAGMTDGFHTADKRNELGYHFGMGTDRYVNGCHKWVFGGEYLQKYYPYKDIRVPVSQFTAEGGYYYNFLSDANKVFLCYAGGSVLAGYETVNWGTGMLFDGSRLCVGDAFVYGGAVSLEIETYLANQVVLLFHARERCLWGNDSGHFHFQFGVGLKIILN